MLPIAEETESETDVRNVQLAERESRSAKAAAEIDFIALSKPGPDRLQSKKSRADLKLLQGIARRVR